MQIIKPLLFLLQLISDFNMTTNGGYSGKSVVPYCIKIVNTDNNITSLNLSSCLTEFLGCFLTFSEPKAHGELIVW